MIIDYDKVLEKQATGYTYYEIWKEWDLPVKFTTFKSAVTYFKSTGKRRKITMINDIFKYSNRTDKFNDEPIQITLDELYIKDNHVHKFSADTITPATRYNFGFMQIVVDGNVTTITINGGGNNE